MQRLNKHTVEKMEAFDFTATGKMHARKLPRARYQQSDFLDYLNGMFDLPDLDDELFWDDGA